MKQYNPRHPKGNKFSEAELIGHRDHWYELVQKGIGSANKAGEKPVEPITISKTPDSEPENLFRIETGKELLAFASNAAGMEYDYDEPSDEEELDLITNFCSEVQGLLDYDALFDAADNIRTAFSLSKEIRKIESHHFWVFCGSASRTVSGGIMPSAPFKVLIIRILRNDNPIIQKIAIEEEKNE